MHQLSCIIKNKLIKLLLFVLYKETYYNLKMYPAPPLTFEAKFLSLFMYLLLLSLLDLFLEFHFSLRRLAETGSYRTQK